MSGSFEKISLSGTPEEIGFAHGLALADLIHKNIAFYQPIFLNNLGTEAKVLEAAAYFKHIIKQFNPDFVIEIDHIAKGANVSDPLWLYALNARTELALTMPFSECTALVFPQTNILGQTWDWAEQVEDTTVIMEITLPSGHKILQLTEAGIIGKIGQNNFGLGTTLNILWLKDNHLSGVPIHIVLRAILETKDIQEAKSIIARSSAGKASNVIVAHDHQAINVEFGNGLVAYHQITNKAYCHTNHCRHIVSSEKINEDEHENSLIRYKTVDLKLTYIVDYSIQDMIEILSDQSHGDNSILSPYSLDSEIDMGYCGTLATLVMDLDNGIMKVRKGNPATSIFGISDFREYHI